MDDAKIHQKNWLFVSEIVAKIYDNSFLTSIHSALYITSIKPKLTLPITMEKYFFSYFSCLRHNRNMKNCFFYPHIIKPIICRSLTVGLPQKNEISETIFAFLSVELFFQHILLAMIFAWQIDLYSFTKEAIHFRSISLFEENVSIDIDIIPKQFAFFSSTYISNDCAFIREY